MPVSAIETAAASLVFPHRHGHVALGHVVGDGVRDDVGDGFEQSIRIARDADAGMASTFRVTPRAPA